MLADNLNNRGQDGEPMSKVTNMAHKLKRLSQNMKSALDVPDPDLVTPKRTVEKLTDICKCTFCTSWLQDPVEASCGHLFCASCLLRPSELKISMIACPCCSAKISCRSAKSRNDIQDLVRIKMELENVFTKELTNSDEILSKIKDPELFSVPLVPPSPTQGPAKVTSSDEFLYNVALLQNTQTGRKIDRMLGDNLYDRRGQDGEPMSKVTNMAHKLKRLSQNRKSALKVPDPEFVTPKKTVEKLTDIFKCTFCTYWLQEPVEASCGHLFCASCLLQISELTHKGSWVACPCCSVKISSRSAKSRNDIQDLVRIKMELENVFTKELTNSDEILSKIKDPESFSVPLVPPSLTQGPAKVTSSDEFLYNVAEIVEKPKEYVFCPTRLNKKQTAKLNELCKLCNGQIRKKYSLDVTHLIIQLTNGRVPQTLKYLLAIAGRKWVVIYDWVEKCVETGKLLPEDEYETSNFKHCDAGVKLSRLSKTNLFDGFKFYFATDNFKQLGFTLDEVLMLMQTLGAEVLPSVEKIQDTVVIVGHSKGNTTEYYNWLHAKQWLTVTFEWLIECILEYRLLPFSSNSNHTCISITNHELETANVPKSLQICISQHLAERAVVNSGRSLQP